MSRVLRLKAADSMQLVEMGADEIERHVSEMAGRTLDLMPESNPIGINAVSLGQIAADAEVWAEWTRACCGSRNRIEDFVDPPFEDFSSVISPAPLSLHGAHVESQLRTVRLEGPGHRAE